MSSEEHRSQPDEANPSASAWRSLRTRWEMVAVAGAVIDLMRDWRLSRSWGKVCFLFPPLLIAAILIGTITASQLTPSFRKLSWYAKAAESELEQKAAATTKGESSENAERPSETNTAERSAITPPSQSDALQVDEYVVNLFRRVLQIEPENIQARFYVAMQMAKLGELNTARRMIQSLAPVEKKGFEPAHAWLSLDMLGKARRGERVEIGLLKHHLKHGTSRDDASPFLLLLYSQLLQQENNIDESMDVLRRAALADTRLQLNASATFMQRGLKVQAKLAADTLIASYNKRLAEKESEELRQTIAQAYIVTERVDEAIKSLQEGIVKNPNSRLLRRMLSSIFRVRFQRSIQVENGNLRANIEALDAAISIDPTNVDVSQDLELIKRFGVGTVEATIQQLRDRIATSGTSYVAHLLLAEAAYSKKDLRGAIGHYDLVLTDLPAMTIAMNNMAMMLVELDPSKIDDSLKLLDRAIELNPNASEFHDSRASLLRTAGRPSEAMASFERAIAINPLRVATLEQAISLATELGADEQVGKLTAKLEEAKKVLQQRADAMKSEMEKRREANSSENPDLNPSSQPISSPEVKPSETASPAPENQ